MTTHQQEMEQMQRWIDDMDASLYEIKKNESLQHDVGCHCEKCDWVDDYEAQQEKKIVESWAPCFDY